MITVSYNASEGVRKLYNGPTMDGLVREAMRRFLQRQTEIKDETSFYVCRLLVGKDQEMGDDPALVVFIMLQKDGQIERHLLTWQEAVDKGIEPALKGGYRQGPGKLLFPDKVPMP